MMVAGFVGSHRVTQIMSIVAMSANDNEADDSDDDTADNENESSLTLNYELVPGNTQILCWSFGIKLNDNGTIEERARKLHKLRS